MGQAGAQLAAMATTIGVGLLGGLLTGILMRAAGALQWGGSDVICPAGRRFDDNFSFICHQPEDADKIQVEEELGNLREI